MSEHDAYVAEKLGELLESLEALRRLGRQLTVHEQELVELARSQPRLKPTLKKEAEPPKTAARPARPAKPKTATEKPLADSAGENELRSIREEIGDCTRCKLHQGRKNIVFGDGTATAELMFVGEGPGADEDEQGLPFVGRAGQLLNKMIAAMGKRRDEVYIGNIVKCRPPGNREPEGDEVAMCLPFLQRQIRTIHPKMIVCLGRVAIQNLLDTKRPISQLRGQWQLYEDIRVMPTFHPAYLLRNPAAKKPAWEDLQKVMAELGWPLPKKEG
ncbi:MAG: uracil-DNA glycosylase [Myxococcales bacterium]|nr:uracil-DNA glycosylase [Myxococcales bacterium]